MNQDHPQPNLNGILTTLAAAGALSRPECPTDPFDANVQECIRIIRDARRPVKWGYVRELLAGHELRGLETAVAASPGVNRKKHKNIWYYTA